MKAYKFLTGDFSRKEIIAGLMSKDLTRKIACIIKLDCVKNQNEVDLLIVNLTQQDGLIREAVSNKINELMKSGASNFFQDKKIILTFIEATIDVNPSVARNIVEILPLVNEQKFLINEILKKIFVFLDELKEFRQKNHIYTKKVFKIYWLMEALSVLQLEISDDLIKILEITSEFDNYTIREKCAKIVVKFDEFIKIKNKLKNDKNPYVKRFLD